MLLLVNKVPGAFDPSEIRHKVSEAYGCEVIGILPHEDELMALASAEMFTIRYPDHPVSHEIQRVVEKLMT